MHPPTPSPRNNEHPPLLPSLSNLLTLSTRASRASLHWQTELPSFYQHTPDANPVTRLGEAQHKQQHSQKKKGGAAHQQIVAAWCVCVCVRRPGQSEASKAEATMDASDTTKPPATAAAASTVTIASARASAHEPPNVPNVPNVPKPRGGPGPGPGPGPAMSSVSSPLAARPGHELPFVQPSSYLRPSSRSHPLPPVATPPMSPSDEEQMQGLVSRAPNPPPIQHRRYLCPHESPRLGLGFGVRLRASRHTCRLFCIRLGPSWRGETGTQVVAAGLGCMST